MPTMFMHFRDGTPIEVFIPLYTNHTVLRLSDFYTLSLCFYTLEWAAHIASLFILYCGLRLFSNQQLLHVNFARIFIFLICQLYLLIVTRVVMFLAQIDVITIHYIVEDDILLLVFSFLMFFMMGSATFTILGAAVERVFATIYVVDYEFNRRTYISTIIILVNILAASIFAYMMLKHLLTIYYSVPILLGALILPILLFSWISYANYRNERRLSTHFSLQGTYSVSLRYQLNENLSSLKLMRNVVFSSALVIFVSIFFYSVPKLILLQVDRANDGDPLQNLFNALFEAISSFIGIGMIATAYGTLNGIHSICPLLLIMNRYRNRRSNPRKSSIRVHTSKENETDTYFKQLQNSWEMHEK